VATADPTDLFLRKMTAFVRLTPEERDVLAALPMRTVRMKAGDDLIREGDRPDRVHLLIDGWACRYKILPDGGRQILAYLIPGDLCDIHIFILKKMDHGISLLSDATVGLIDPQAMLELLDSHPRVARALYWATLVDEAVLREWLVNVARRDPYERLAHLFCEMWLRMATVGLVDDNRFDLPLTQAELGDTVGLTPVTVNRVIQRLRGEGLITLKGGQLEILDVERLKRIAEFNDNYLHLDRERGEAGNG
jgi:CRP-like cAMP-binding protein